MNRALDRQVGRLAAIVIVIIAAASDRARADALVVTRAMQASTIAEIFVDEHEIRTEIEIGESDAAAFANVLPDELHEKVAGKKRRLNERLRTFFESDWIVQADGRPLQGKLVRIVPARRVVRDEVTGEALTEQPADAEIVIRVTLRHALKERPRSLMIRSPKTDAGAGASIGFVCYHNGLPVNDFRYLPAEATLDLDWVDSWYSRFRHPNLTRQFDAPMSAYLYVEPYEIRNEIIIRPKDMQAWLDLDLSGDGKISVEQQPELKRRVAEFLSEKNVVIIDGQPVEGRLDRIHFIHRTLRATGIIEPAVDLDATSATLGVIFVYPVDGLPERVSMKWELFGDKIQSISAVASDEAGGLPTVLTPDAPVLEWRNYLKNPTNALMKSVADTPLTREFTVPLVSALCGGFAVVMLAILGWGWSNQRPVSRLAVWMFVAAATIAVLSSPFAKISIANPLEKQPDLSNETAADILASLLHNVYRSFDHHNEDAIYDRLAESISGDLLADVYLETRKSMELKNQGGLRISVKVVTVTDIESTDGDMAEAMYRCRWRVSGWIGHWGHIHARANEHVALVTIAPRDGVWKITGLEILDESPAETLPKSDTSETGGGA